jgi:serine/threonine protein kinase
MRTLVGTLLNGRYRLDAKIGAGGMSTVYLAFDQTLERPVAIKLLHREIAGDSDQLERFRREARSVAQLSHPHIVTVIDAGEDDGRPYIVFEYVEGETLKDRIRRLGQLPVAEALAYAIEIARALGAAHARNIVHRDVKPQNVLIDTEGSGKVTDFGIARSLDEEGLTADGRVLGTTDYVSPEQALGHPVTGQSDLYSLGIVLYEMLTGEVPFKGDNQVAVAMKHVREELPDIQARRPGVSAALAAGLLLAAAVAAGLIVALGRQTHSGTGTSGVGRPPPGLAAVSLRQDAAVDYDPYGTGGAGEHPDQRALAVDRDPSTFWSTERYSGGLGAKPGVGIYVDASPGVAARALEIRTPDAGWTAGVYAARSRPPKDIGGWKLVAPQVRVTSRRQRFALDTATQPFRHYLVWITKLPASGQVRISEIYLFR